MKIPRARRPKTRLIESSLISDHLPKDKEGAIDWFSTIRIVHPDGISLALTVSPWELLELASQKIVSGVITRKQDKEYLSRAVLIASVHAAWRIVRGLRRPVMRADFISRAHQAKGAKRWVKRHDRARTGHAGSTAQIEFTIADQIYVPAEKAVRLELRTRRRGVGDLGPVLEPTPEFPKAA